MFLSLTAGAARTTSRARRPASFPSIPYPPPALPSARKTRLPLPQPNSNPEPPGF